MTPTGTPQLAARYAAPADQPLVYPGARPKGSYILANGLVWPVGCERARNACAARYPGDATGSINQFLEARGAAPMNARYPLIAYGSNLVPGQLLRKLGADAVVPVLYTRLPRTDIVYNLISNHGYAYAELLLGEDGVEAEAGITFLDRTQLERVRSTEQNYRLVRYPYPFALESDGMLDGSNNASVFFFAGRRKVWSPKAFDGPVAVAELAAKGRKRTSLTQQEVLELAIAEFKLFDIGITTAQELADRIRRQADWEEKAGKLKYDLQEVIHRRPDSRPTLAKSVRVAGNALPRWRNGRR